MHLGLCKYDEVPFLFQGASTSGCLANGATSEVVHEVDGLGQHT